MRIFLCCIFLFPFELDAHPGIGIVKDSKGNIYYTDLQQVWKITGGKRSVLIPGSHTHELYVDDKDNLYGEGGYYDEKSKKFYHYLWIYRSNGRFDTLIGIRDQYKQHNFSLARDRVGNEYYLKRFIAPYTDTNHIYKRSAGGEEIIFASGNFKNVNWLHPQDDGSVLYVSGNAIYSADRSGNITTLKSDVANSSPRFSFSSGVMIWGVWKDNEKNIYAAVFSDQAVKKIDKNGNITEVYRSDGNWSPLHGVFDNEGNLWVLESSDKNDVRVIEVKRQSRFESRTNKFNKILAVTLIIACLLLYFFIFHKKKKV